MIFRLSVSTTSGVIQVDGGTAIVNGNIVQLGAEVITIPVVVEVFAGYPTPATTISTITWYLCVNQVGELELVASTDFDPFGAFAATYAAAGVDQTRMFFVSNPTVANAYPIRATYFSDLVINNRDITPIAIITATTSGSPASITSISAASAVDTRRFITNGYSGLTSPFVLSTSGSFRSLTSLNNWLIQLANWNAGYEGENFVGTDVIVKGNFPITSATTLSFLSQVRFIGDGGVFNVTTPTAFNLGNHVSFDGITFNYNYDPLVSDAGYVSSDLVNATNNQGCLYCNVLAYNDISIKSCTFNWVPYTTPPASTAVNRYPFIYFAFASISGGNGLLEGVEISNNIFNSQVSGFIAANQVDIRAAIAFIMQVAGTPLLSQGVQLVNCNITNNVCYQDQMIILSSVLSSSSLVEAITTINTNITYNQCGTIGFITRYYYINQNNSSSNLQNSPGGLNTSITVSNNTCKLIDALDSTGTELTNSLVTDSNMTTGASIIENNTVSWIKVLVNQPSSPSGPVPVCTSIIKNNNLFAYYLTPSSSYIAPYNASYASNPPSNAAIYVINSATTTPAFSYAGTTGNIIIEGNTINNGIYSGPLHYELYTYDFGIYSEHNAIISNNTVNTLGAVLTASPTGIVVAGNVSSSIQNNTLNRNGVHWNLYINCLPANIPDLVSHPIITHNTFDSTTVDGSSNVLVGNLPVYAFYSENINQTAFAAASLLDDQNYFAIGITPSNEGLTSPAGSGLPAYPYSVLTYDNSSGVTIARANNSYTYPLPRAEFLQISDVRFDRATPHERNYSRTIMLDKVLPNNVKIINVKFGVFLTQTAGNTLDTSVASNNQISLTLLSYSNIQQGPASAFGNGIADVKNTLLNVSDVLFDNATTDAPPGTDDIFSVSSTLSVGAAAGANVTEGQLITNTHYCSIDASANQSNFITGQNNNIVASFDMNWLTTTSGTSTIIWYVSPILIEYQW